MAKPDSMPLLSGRSARSFVRYVLVGLSSNLLGYLAYLALTLWWKVEPKLAMTVLYALACLIAFFGNRSWTFSYRGNMFWSALRYGTAHILGYLLNLLLLMVFADHLHYPHHLVQAAAVPVVAVFLFLLFRFFVFRESHIGAQERAR